MSLDKLVTYEPRHLRSKFIRRLLVLTTSSLSVSMAAEYVSYGRLLHAHKSGISAIAISPFAKYVATSSFDNDVRVWDLTSHKLVFEFLGSSPTLTIVWYPLREDRLFCGSQDGCISILMLAVVSTALRLAPEDNPQCYKLSLRCHFASDILPFSTPATQR